eukprot:3376935-Rhodomonas_salina.1
MGVTGGARGGMGVTGGARGGMGVASGARNTYAMPFGQATGAALAAQQRQHCWHQPTGNHAYRSVSPHTRTSGDVGGTHRRASLDPTQSHPWTSIGSKLLQHSNRPTISYGHPPTHNALQT